MVVRTRLSYQLEFIWKRTECCQCAEVVHLYMRKLERLSETLLQEWVHTIKNYLSALVNNKTSWVSALLHVIDQSYGLCTTVLGGYFSSNSIWQSMAWHGMTFSESLYAELLYCTITWLNKLLLPGVHQHLECPLVWYSFTDVGCVLAL